LYAKIKNRILALWIDFVNHCLICHNKTAQQTELTTICAGCEALLSYPTHRCSICGIELPHDHSCCGTCQNKPPPFSQVDYACEYQPPVDKWVMSLKFGENLLITRLFAELLLPKLNSIEDDYLLMPVPLHKSRLRSRGYNQAYEIAKELAKDTKRVLDTSLIRHKNTAMQAELKLKQRAHNVNKAFKVTSSVKDKKIILIDDVMTSGNTLRECAKTLIKAGAFDVKVLIFARKSLN
jgi:ComF family protein